MMGHLHIISLTRVNCWTMFPRRGRNGPVAWPARSSVMTPSDFFLWSAMKSLVNETSWDSEEDLAATSDMAEIPNVLESV